MVVDPGAVDPAVGAVDLDGWRFGELIQARYAISCWGLAVCLGFRLVELVVLGIGLVDISPNLQVELRLGSRCSACFGISILILFAFSKNRIRGRLPWLETTGCIADDLEVAGEWGSNV